MTTRYHPLRVQAWLNMMRSPAYTKSRGVMRRVNAYCPLGLACELYRRETGRGKWDEWYSFWLDGECYTHVPPQQVLDWLGVLSEVFDLVDYGGIPRITDETDLSLLDMADWIAKEFNRHYMMRDMLYRVF